VRRNAGLIGFKKLGKFMDLMFAIFRIVQYSAKGVRSGFRSTQLIGGWPILSVCIRLFSATHHTIFTRWSYSRNIKG
jgi:hypothetical protein